MAQICPTAKLERLVLPTDGSEFSEGAVREAISLAKTCSSKLVAVSVIETNPEYETIAPQLIEKAEKEAREYLESVKARALKEGVECEIIAHQGEEPYRYIVEEAEKNKADMIVMGRRGRRGLKRLMMGSETAKTIGHAHCNVLVVPRAARLEFKNILMATDGSKYSDIAASEAISIAKRCGSSLIALSVIHSDVDKKCAEENIKKIKELAEKEGVKVDALIAEGRPFEVVVNTAKNKNADTIVTGTHGRTALARLLMGSVTERVIGTAECAVLVVKAK
ncbi:MAG: universal stress protein [Nitrospirae bacterium]|nr:universal stress protein [Nitrospirota bacterium]